MYVNTFSVSALIMDVQRGHCWRCEKVLPQLTVPCSRCNIAVYCSTPCLGNDTARHSSVECQMFGPQRCGNCEKTAPNMKECAGCSNAWYCSKECQRTDWKSHKPSCRAAEDSMKRAAKALCQQRSATYKISGNFPYYIGNIFARDFLQLEDNELTSGVKENSLARDYHILSAGCGNLRNTVLTAASLPDEYHGKLYISLDDFDPFVMARNVLFLFMLVRFADTDYIASSLTTIWYSLHIYKREYDLIKTSLDELTQMSAQQLHDTTKGLVSVLDKDLRCLCQVWERWQSLECQRDQKTSVNLKQQRNALFGTDILMREGVPFYLAELSKNEKKRMREWFDHALFLPSESRKSAVPFDNPTLTGRDSDCWYDDFTPIVPKDHQFVYCINTDAFPFREWDCLRVRECSSGSFTSPMEMYHSYVTNLLKKVRRLIVQERLFVHVFLDNCLVFPERHQSLQMTNYDRIITSNLADIVGFARLLQTFKPLLNASNRFSVIITETMNWFKFIPEADTDSMLCPRQRIQGCNDAYSIDCNRLRFPGHNNTRDYFNNTPQFLQYLRADIMAGGLGIPSLKEVPSFESVKKYHGLQMRDFRKGQNKLVPFQYRLNARILNMMNGYDRAVEWCLPQSSA
ncbi:uncharacterized protein LOC119722100 [Patiria miniata]|uniref:MYND-type domain-containing protein n=1 Tax=Patiria miniata TaxID=46514 RepID=A0A913Z8C8_PATMI|nr:uncharacterized protein LOC119722100 [Patiria miniata]